MQLEEFQINQKLVMKAVTMNKIKTKMEECMLDVEIFLKLSAPLSQYLRFFVYLLRFTS